MRNIRDIVDTVMSGLAMTVLVAGIVSWATILEALSR
jgi:hypothetical protein